MSAFVRYACSSCGDRPAMRGSDLCARCDSEALGEVRAEPLVGFTPDDSAWCNVCVPPHETSVAMLARHLWDVHGIDVSEAEIRDAT